MQNLKKRYLKDCGNSFFLFGPRGTGKSTWLKEKFRDCIYIDLLDPVNYRRFSTRPESLKYTLDGNPEKNLIVIDEIQKVPQLLDMVHKLMEDKREKKFILTGSSTRKLKRHGIDLLAGRAAIRNMFPFMASELGTDFSFNKALETGLLPVIYFSQNPVEALKAYLTLYIREEVQMEGFVRDIGAFSRFLEASSFAHASVLNVSSIARECEVKRKTVENYLSLMEDLMLSFQLPVFTKKAKRSMIKHNKFFIFDTGVFRDLKPAGPLARAGEMEGPALEGLVAQHLYAWADYSADGAELFFWRTLAGSEIDFVLYGKDLFCAIEVKNRTRIDNVNFRAFKSFEKDYPQAEKILLYRGTERLKKGGVLCLPVDEFLCSLVPGKALF